MNINRSRNDYRRIYALFVVISLGQIAPSCSSAKNMGNPDKTVSGILYANFSNDGKLLVVLNRESKWVNEAEVPQSTKVTIYNIDGMKPMTSFPCSRWSMTVAVSPDAKLLATQNDDSVVDVWEISSKKKIASFRDTALVSDFIFSADNQYLLVGLEDKTNATAWGKIKVWNLKTQERVPVFNKEESGIFKLAMSPTGTQVAATLVGGVDVQLWEFPSGKKGKNLKVKLHERMAFFPSGKQLAVSSRFDGTVGVWDVSSGKLLYSLSGHGKNENIWTVALSKDGTKLLAGYSQSSGGVIKYWDLKKKVVIAAFEQEEPLSTALFWPNQNKIVSFSELSLKMRIWNLEDKSMQALSLEK